jgi:hypothetical protein
MDGNDEGVTPAEPAAEVSGEAVEAGSGEKRDFNWATIGSVGLLAASVIALLALTFATRGEATPPPYLGEIRTPQRFAYVEPTPTPEGASDDDGQPADVVRVH